MKEPDGVRRGRETAREKWISLLSYKCGKAHANILEAENTIDKTIETLCEIMSICDTVEVINSEYPELHKNIMVAFNAYIEHCDAIEEMSRKIYTFVDLLGDIAAGADSRRTEELNESIRQTAKSTTKRHN